MTRSVSAIALNWLCGTRRGYMRRSSADCDDVAVAPGCSGRCIATDWKSGKSRLPLPLASEDPRLDVALPPLRFAVQWIRSATVGGWRVSEGQTARCTGFHRLATVGGSFLPAAIGPSFHCERKRESVSRSNCLRTVSPSFAVKTVSWRWSNRYL